MQWLIWMLRKLPLAGLVAVVLLPCAALAGELGFRDVPTSPVLGACGMVAGSVAIQGTATCLRIGGRLQADFASNFAVQKGRLGAVALGSPAQPVAITRDPLTSSRVHGYVSLDARTPTDYGPLRAFVSVRSGRGRPLLDRQSEPQP